MAGKASPSPPRTTGPIVLSKVPLRLKDLVPTPRGSFPRPAVRRSKDVDCWPVSSSASGVGGDADTARTSQIGRVGPNDAAIKVALAAVGVTLGDRTLSLVGGDRSLPPRRTSQRLGEPSGRRHLVIHLAFLELYATDLPLEFDRRCHQKDRCHQADGKDDIGHQFVVGTMPGSRS